MKTCKNKFISLLAVIGDQDNNIFLVPDIEIVHKVVDELHSNGIENRHIHVLAKRDTPLEGLPEAGISCVFLN